jgi:hypothetical protein
MPGFTVTKEAWEPSERGGMGQPAMKDKSRLQVK